MGDTDNIVIRQYMRKQGKLNEKKESRGKEPSDEIGLRRWRGPSEEMTFKQ